ncbi:hypothetical protein ACLB0R_13005 [Sphingomonas sp. GlSt437]|uniref:hypothetical protein n=1 Tax=Sphingomonas sp. GlSt437 TaxID=3389970 RepID=UPI003A85E20F
MKRSVILILPLALAACGAQRALQPGKGAELPVAPIGATERPDANKLVHPAPDARPVRSDEVLTGSQERRTDDFDLPPPN